MFQRPTLANIRQSLYEFDNPESVDPYELLFCYSDDNIEKFLELSFDVSSFFKKKAQRTKAKPLIMSVALLYCITQYGVQHFQHGIIFPHPLLLLVKTTEINDTAYARNEKFLSAAPVNEGILEHAKSWQH